LGGVGRWPGTEEVKMGAAAPGIGAAALCLLNVAFAWRWLRESHRPAADHRERIAPHRALWKVVAHGREPSSRLIWIYAIAIGASQGTSAVLALFLAERFAVTERTIGFFYMYIGAISVFARVFLLGRMVDALGEAKLSRVGVVTLAAGIAGMTLAGSLPPLALAVALVPLGTAFTFPCVTGLLSRVVPPADRGLYMGLQQTFGGASRVAVPLFYGWAFDSMGIVAPFWFAAGLVLATLPLGIGLGRYAGRRSDAAA